MKTEIINQIIEAYKQNDLEECESKLFFLMLLYNTDIRKGEVYDHDLKHILFKTNFIRNPIGMKYTKEDYEKTKQILMDVLNLSKAINDPGIDTQDTFRKDITIDERIIKDILDVAVYTDCFYKMNSVNSNRMDECKTSKIPFVEQLITILLFHQDQTRLAKRNYQEFLDKDCITGIELSVSNRPVEYYDNLNGSVSDSFESMLEGMNEIIHFLYYKSGDNLETQILDTHIRLEFIHPYENVEFERYLYIASQRYLLCRIEEGIRYGYYGLGYMDKAEEGLQVYAFSLESDEKYKARRIGILRREYQVRSLTMFDHRNQDDLSVAYETLAILANDLINVQEEKYVLLDFNKFHPDKDLFQKAEGVAKPKEHIVEFLTKDYYLNCSVKGIKVCDLLCTYNYLDALSEVLYFASVQLIDDENPDTYDYTPLKYENIFITDDSSYLKYFTNPYVDAIEVRPGDATIQNLKSIWKKGYPDAKEFMEYLMNPVTTCQFSNYMEKQFIPVPVMDEKDCAIFSEDYMLIKDPIKAAVLKEEKDVKKVANRTAKKIYPNDPCPCGSGKKYKKCCKNKAKM